MRGKTWPILLALIALLTVPAAARESESTAQIKEQFIKLLASISMKLNLSIDDKFCRQFFEDFKKQKE